MSIDKYLITRKSENTVTMQKVCCGGPRPRPPHPSPSPSSSPPGPIHHLQHQNGGQTLALQGFQGDVHSALSQRVNLAA